MEVKRDSSCGNRKKRILFLLSNLLGLSFWSKKIYELTQGLDWIDKEYLFINREDYKKFSPPRLIRKSDTLTSAWITKKKLISNMASYSFDGIFCNFWESLPGVSQILKDLPIVMMTDITAETALSLVKARKLMEHRLKATDKLEFLIRKGISDRIYKKLLKQVKFFLPSTKECSESLIKNYGISQNKINIVPFAIDTDFWIPSDRKKNQKPVLLFVGNDFRRKGGDFLVELFREYLSSRCTLRIISNDRYLKSYSLPKGVELFQGLSHKDLQRIISLYQTADCFVFPSKWDTFSIVIHEAFSVGLPVVCSDHIAGAKESIVDGVNGYLIPFGDKEMWAKRITELLDNDDLRRKMGKNSRKYALENFSVEEFNKTIIGAIKKIVYE